MFEGKVVKVSSLDLFRFFVPGFEVMSRVPQGFVEKKVLYVGEYRDHLLNYLRDRTEGFISTAGTPSITLVTREEWTGMVAHKYRRKVGKAVMDMLNSWPQERFEWFLKMFWMTGKYPVAAEDVNVSMFEFFDFYCHEISVDTIVKAYFQILEKMPFYYLESSMMTFLSKVKAHNSVAGSPKYLKMLAHFWRSYGRRIDPEMKKYFRLREGDPMVFLMTLLSIRGL